MTTEIDTQCEPHENSRRTAEEDTKPGGLLIKDLGAVSKKTRGGFGIIFEGANPPFQLQP